MINYYIEILKDIVEEDDLQKKIFNVYNIYEKSINMIKEHGITKPFLEAGNKFIIKGNDLKDASEENILNCMESMYNKSLNTLEKIVKVAYTIL